MAQRTILVTGAAGFVGFHLVRHLTEGGARVVGIDNLNAYYDPALKSARLRLLEEIPAFRFERLDLADHEGVMDAVARHRPDVVVHLAAQAGVRHSIEAPRAYAASNLDGFLSVLEACRRHPPSHLLYASSSSVYGANTKVPFAESDPVDLPVSFYAATKRANEVMARSYAHLYAIPCSGLRFFTVYGPWGRPDMAYYGFTEAILEGRPITLFNGGRMRRDFTYVGDVLDGICGLIDRPPGSHDVDAGGAPHQIYNIGNNEPVELARFVTAIETATGCRAERRFEAMQPGDVTETYADIAKLGALTGFAPKTSIEDGMARFVAWYREWRAGRAG
ncbi:NAD-dependent epimerase/dehydratase family protein [Fulvimarina endophytica]|uniref:NAD-dependent epimerase/dehydratase family protein n=1 Tax=Fulvimarina endophytica TaxID=2293836 RepID=A0A371X4P9_9HYPH|nr:NAD-dependent epimerase/dehydratase family protein [Fulvimarina endophytica]RFC64193.1 NAD-dependent epimerase/dehydratase family protein [Fulvimarina endophytica]